MKYIYKISLVIMFVAVISTAVYITHGKNPDGVGDLSLSRVITLGDDGFIPSELTILEGESVTFVTTRSNFFWPASNLHPSHSIYSEFDPKRPLTPEESWTFTFNKSGQWEYHDHLTPYFIGTIFVHGENKVEGVCEREGGSIECLGSKILNILDKDGVDAAYNEIANLYEVNKDFKESCHSIAHNVGLASFKYYLKDENSVLSKKTSVCAYGFYHGFMEALLTRTGDVSAARDFCLFVGRRMNQDTPDAELQCFHGIGHGAVDLAVATDGPQKDERNLVDNSLRICEQVSQTNEEIYRCTSGVYNSLANIYITNEGYILRKDDPLWICKEQPEEYKESCYGNMNTLLMGVTDRDLSKAVPLIREIEYSHQVSSMRYLANLSSIYTILGNNNYDGQLAVCRSLESRLHNPCIEGLVLGLLEHGAPEKEYVEAIEFCGSKSLTEVERDICFSASIGNITEWYSLPKAKEICLNLEERYQHYCTQI
ncbi:MAG: hypothetical protein WD509_00900 [Candidatus Paceibacterota bacterium]